MPKSSEVATELRKLADALDTIPDAKINAPAIYWTHIGASDKESFLRVARVLPRPLAKEYEDGERGDLNLRYKSDALRIISSIPRAAVCRIVEPAKPAVYDCVPILEQHELDAISA